MSDLSVYDSTQAQMDASSALGKVALVESKMDIQSVLSADYPKHDVKNDSSLSNSENSSLEQAQVGATSEETSDSKDSGANGTLSQEMKNPTQETDTMVDSFERRPYDANSMNQIEDQKSIRILDLLHQDERIDSCEGGQIFQEEAFQKEEDQERKEFCECEPIIRDEIPVAMYKFKTEGSAEIIHECNSDFIHVCISNPISDTPLSVCPEQNDIVAVGFPAPCRLETDTNIGRNLLSADKSNDETEIAKHEIGSMLQTSQSETRFSMKRNNAAGEPADVSEDEICFVNENPCPLLCEEESPAKEFLELLSKQPSKPYSVRRHLACMYQDESACSRAFSRKVLSASEVRMRNSFQSSESAQYEFFDGLELKQIVSLGEMKPMSENRSDIKCSQLKLMDYLKDSSTDHVLHPSKWKNEESLHDVDFLKFLPWSKSTTITFLHKHKSICLEENPNFETLSAQGHQETEQFPNHDETFENTEFASSTIPLIEETLDDDLSEFMAAEGFTILPVHTRAKKDNLFMGSNTFNEINQPSKIALTSHSVSPNESIQMNYQHVVKVRIDDNSMLAKVLQYVLGIWNELVFCI